MRGRPNRIETEAPPQGTEPEGWLVREVRIDGLGTVRVPDSPTALPSLPDRDVTVRYPEASVPSTRRLRRVGNQPEPKLIVSRASRYAATSSPEPSR